MKKIGIYPGSFNPWHKGHRDILDKALEVFDEIYIYKMLNPEKNDKEAVDLMVLSSQLSHLKNVTVKYSSETLLRVVQHESMSNKEIKFSIVRGLRNGNDLTYEMNNQYWNEDFGIYIPFVYFITDRALGHVSSTAIRTLAELGLKHSY